MIIVNGKEENYLTISSKYKVLSIPSKTNSKFDFWKTLEINDVIEIKITIKYTYYSQEIELININKNITFNTTEGKLNNYISKYDLEKIS